MKAKFILATVCLVTILLATADAQAAGPTDPRAYQIGAGGYPRLIVTNAHGTLKVTKIRSDLKVQLDGKPVSAEQLRQEGAIYKVLDSSQETIFMFGAFGKPRPNGQIIYSPDFDPYTTKSTLGLWAVPLDEHVMSSLEKRTLSAMARQAGFEPDQVLIVSRVIDGSPADAAGVRELDLVTRADGAGVEDPKQLHRLATDKQGELLELGLLREGQEFDVELAVYADIVWPEAELLERQFKKVSRP